MNFCRLPNLDPWDPVIERYLDPSKLIKWEKECKPNVELITGLKDGKIFIEKKFVNKAVCAWMCWYPKDDWNIFHGKSYNLSQPGEPDCDIVEVTCRFKDKKDWHYRHLHTQIYVPKKYDNFTSSEELESNNSTSEELVEFNQDLNKPPDVHILVFDSSSASAFHRTMSKTVHFLREKYGAISFPYFNKIGLNSRPNGYAFLLGKSYTDFLPKYYCDVVMNDEQFIGFEFRDIGYKTAMSEDWWMGVFNWPRCVGFKNMVPVDHYMRPFQIRAEGKKKDKTINHSVFGGTCHEPHERQLEYLKQFIDAYGNTPKFSLTWMSYLAHEDVNGLYHADVDYYKFLKEYMLKLNNSYIIVMGDHGLRFGGIRRTHVGVIEDNNPALFMVVPERLRRNHEIMATVRENAQQLVTHYDLYATLADITRTPLLSNHAKRLKPAQKLFIRGSSFFKPLPQPRNCPTLGIPMDYCICQREKIVRQNQTLAKDMAEFLVTWINNYISANNGSSSCTNLVLKNGSVMLEEFEPSFHVDVYIITFDVTPSNGKFSGYVAKDVDTKTNRTVISLISEKVTRLNAYKGQSDCVVESANVIAPYCYCKNLLKKKG